VERGERREENSEKKEENGECNVRIFNVCIQLQVTKDYPTWKSIVHLSKLPLVLQFPCYKQMLYPYLNNLHYNYTKRV
jgi:hypothetical protein